MDVDSFNWKRRVRYREEVPIGVVISSLIDFRKSSEYLERMKLYRIVSQFDLKIFLFFF